MREVDGMPEVPRAVSQLRVNAGTIRPPITEISTIMAAMPRRQPSPNGIATSSTCRCISRLAIASTMTGASSG